MMQYRIVTINVLSHHVSIYRLDETRQLDDIVP